MRLSVTHQKHKFEMRAKFNMKYENMHCSWQRAYNHYVIVVDFEDKVIEIMCAKFCIENIFYNAFIFTCDVISRSVLTIFNQQTPVNITYNSMMRAIAKNLRHFIQFLSVCLIFIHFLLIIYVLLCNVY